MRPRHSRTETGNRHDLPAHRTDVNTTLITHEELQVKLSEAVASRSTRSEEEQRTLLSELLATAFATTETGPEAA